MKNGDALNTLTAYDRFDVTNLYTITEKSDTSNLLQSTGTAYGPETCHNHVLIRPKMNVTNPLINNLPMHIETESLIHVLNAQPWLAKNSAASTLV